MKTSKAKLFSKILMILFFIAYYLPLLSIVVFSFNDAKSVTHWGGFTLNWYKELFTNTRLLEIILMTLLIAVISTLISIIIGTLGAIALSKTSKKFKRLILQVNNLPIMNPDIVTAIGLLLLFVSLSVEKGYITMLIAHISFCTPYVVVTIYPKLKSLNPNLMEASMDLGAKPLTAIRTVLLPQMKESIFAAAAISFTMSFDDFVISYFTGGSKLNISTYLYTEAKKINPTINALSTIIMVIIVLKIIFDKIKERKKKNEEEND